ncbi:phosphonoacetaldehyde reductase [Oribacterium sp. NK2B42]|uniref:phosphonoacetaldehyde reductase n=1 Tax=Oribacterium sp. NK2B42 TaxID=689781 RepID=UPI00042A1BAF|nr:phosphonoacetaldehyde reductase [Oribacterium sp. NK2B42]
MEQIILYEKNQYEKLDEWLSDKKTLVVCGSGYRYINKAKSVIDSHRSTVLFDNFKPNPVYESVLEGVDVFRKNKCDAVMAVGGGSAIDLAKCIRIFSTMQHDKNYLDQEIKKNDIPLLVIPTTAGTGSEATRYAVIYKDGEKQSITSEYCIPEIVLFDPDNLNSLPEYQRKATMMDAFAHSLESMWSINSTEESMEYASEALELIKTNIYGYMENTYEGNLYMLKASNLAGKAINISQTTAGHAMCYKITGLFGCAHGHAAMMCNRILFPWMIEHMEKCVDERGQEHLKNAFQKIGIVLGLHSAGEAVDYVERVYSELKLYIPNPNKDQLAVLCKSVNADRLKNNPIMLDTEDIKILYKKILGVNY